MAADKELETVAKRGLMQQRIRGETQLCWQNSCIKPKHQYNTAATTAAIPPPLIPLSFRPYLTVNDECLISVGTDHSLRS